MLKMISFDFPSGFLFCICSLKFIRMLERHEIVDIWQLWRMRNNSTGLDFLKAANISGVIRQLVLLPQLILDHERVNKGLHLETC